MATWDDSEEEISEEEQAALALMARTDESEAETTSEAESDSEENEVQDEVLAPFSTHELKSSLLEMVEKYNSLKDRYKRLKNVFADTSKI